MNTLEMERFLNAIGLGELLKSGRFVRSYDSGKVETTYVGLDGKTYPVPIARPLQTRFFHYTSEGAQTKILFQGFHPSSVGTAGKGAYLAADRQSSKGFGDNLVEVALDPSRTRMADVTEGDGARIWEAFQQQTGSKEVPAFARRYGYDLVRFDAHMNWYVLQNSAPIVELGSNSSGYPSLLRKLSHEGRIEHVRSLTALVEEWGRRGTLSAGQEGSLEGVSKFMAWLQGSRTHLPLLHQTGAHGQEFEREATRFLDALSQNQRVLARALGERLSQLNAGQELNQISKALLTQFDRETLRETYLSLNYRTRSVLMNVNRHGRVGNHALVEDAVIHEPHPNLRLDAWHELLEVHRNAPMPQSMLEAVRHERNSWLKFRVLTLLSNTSQLDSNAPKLARELILHTEDPRIPHVAEAYITKPEFPDHAPSREFREAVQGSIGEWGQTHTPLRLKRTPRFIHTLFNDVAVVENVTETPGYAMANPEPPKEAPSLSRRVHPVSRWFVGEVAGAGHFAAAYLVKEAFQSVTAGDPRRIKAAIRGMGEPGFWGSLGLFSVAARVGTHGVGRLPLKGVARSLTAHALPLAAGMAAVEFAMGSRSWTQVMIGTGSFLVAGAGVSLVADSVIYPLLFAAGPPGWIAAGLYSIAKAAATLYFGERLEDWIRGLLHPRGPGHRPGRPSLAAYSRRGVKVSVDSIGSR
jgi:hypothetical protein